MPRRSHLIRALVAGALAAAGGLAPAMTQAREPAVRTLRAEGTLETGGARVEILGRPLRAGETLFLPEGFLRVEEAGHEDEQVGSFSVVPAGRGPAEVAAAEPPDATARRP